MDALNNTIPGSEGSSGSFLVSLVLLNQMASSGLLRIQTFIPLLQFLGGCWLTVVTSITEQLLDGQLLVTTCFILLLYFTVLPLSKKQSLSPNKQKTKQLETDLYDKQLKIHLHLKLMFGIIIWFGLGGKEIFQPLFPLCFHCVQGRLP